MSTCQRCGAGNSPRNSHCTTCGMAVATTLSAVPEDLSPLWRLRFDLIEKAGGPKLPQINQLKLRVRWRLRFNIWAVLFGPFYYIAKGMWRKAVTINGPVWALFIVVTILAPGGELDFVIRAANSATVVLLALYANVSYYRKIVLGDNGWW